MEISITFNSEELTLIWHALQLGAIHTPDELKSQKMSELQSKIDIIGALSVKK